MARRVAWRCSGERISSLPSLWRSCKTRHAQVLLSGLRTCSSETSPAHLRLVSGASRLKRSREILLTRVRSECVRCDSRQAASDALRVVPADVQPTPGVWPALLREGLCGVWTCDHDGRQPAQGHHAESVGHPDAEVLRAVGRACSGIDPW